MATLKRLQTEAASAVGRKLERWGGIAHFQHGKRLSFVAFGEPDQSFEFEGQASFLAVGIAKPANGRNARNCAF
jgi:hypothetical protein